MAKQRRFTTIPLTFIAVALLAPMNGRAQDVPEMSAEALAAFAEGMAQYTSADYDAAAEAFARAYGLDSTFALAAFFEGVNWENAGEGERADAAYTRAQAGRHRLSTYYQHRLDAQMAGSALEYLEENRKAARIAPGSKAVYNAGQGAQRLRRSNEALRHLESLDPDRPPMMGWPGYYTVLHQALHNVGRYEDELASARAARTRFPALQALFYDEAEALVALGRVNELEAVIRDFEALGAPLGTFLITLAAEAEAHGQKATHDQLIDRALEHLEALPAEQASTPVARNWTGLAHYSRGDIDAADRIFRQLSEEDPSNNWWRSNTGVMAAERGDRDAAEAEIRRLMDPATPGNRGQLASYAANIAAAMGDGDRFAELIRIAIDRGLLFNNWDHRAPTYRKVRGHPAYLAFSSPAG